MRSCRGRIVEHEMKFNWKELDMRALVVYESMYGNTHLVADAIADGLREARFDVRSVPVAEAFQDEVARADLLVVGGPTHVHGMSTERTRNAAVANIEKSANALQLDPDAPGEGLREWFADLPSQPGTTAAAFDTRIHKWAGLTGRASKGISRLLGRSGFTEVAEPQSFFVDHDALEPGECERAKTWGLALARVVERLTPATSNASRRGA
jgi:hypothetical protein